MANGTVSAEKAAAKAHIDAVNRDYVLQPRLGKEGSSFDISCVLVWDNPRLCCRLPHNRRSQRTLGYRRSSESKIYALTDVCILHSISWESRPVSQACFTILKLASALETKICRDRQLETGRW